MKRLYEKIARMTSEGVLKAAEGRSEKPQKPVQIWDGMQAVWLIYESYPSGRVEASLALRPADVKMLGKEDSSQEFRLAVGSRTWRGEEHGASWSSPERYSRIVEQDTPDNELSDWIVTTVSEALERASREIRPLSLVGGAAKGGQPQSRHVSTNSPSSVPHEVRNSEGVVENRVPTKKAATKKATTKKVTATKKTATAKKTTAKKTANSAKKAATKKSTTAAKKTTAKKATAAKKAANETPAKKTRHLAHT